MFLQFARWIPLILFFSTIVIAHAESAFTVETEMDVHYKKQVPIYLQHELGDVSIQGWNQDLIRVKLKKTVNAESKEEAEILFKKFTLISLETPSTVELRVGTPQGTDLLSKLRNRQQKKNIKVDLEIRAPSSLAIGLVLGSGKKLKLSLWRGKINIIGKQNTLELTKLKTTQPMNVNCPECSMIASDSEFFGSLFVSDQKITLKKTKATPQPILIFSQKGEVNLENTIGDFQIRTQSGDVFAKEHFGALQVQSESGKVKAMDLEGDLDVQSQTGAISVFAKKVLNQFELNSRNGSIDITLPHEFEGEVNLQSIKGEVNTDFIVQKNKKKMEMQYGPELKGKLFGTIGSNHSDLNVSASSESGRIFLRQKESP